MVLECETSVRFNCRGMLTSAPCVVSSIFDDGVKSSQKYISGLLSSKPCAFMACAETWWDDMGKHSPLGVCLWTIFGGESSQKACNVDNKLWNKIAKLKVNYPHRIRKNLHINRSVNYSHLIRKDTSICSIEIPCVARGKLGPDSI